MARCILVADDDPLLVQLVQFRLQHRGYDVLTAEDGERVMQILEERQPDLIVLDAMMPGLDGFEVLRRVKADPRHQGIPVMILSARKKEQDIVGALALGAADYVVKPFMPEELVARIRRILGADV